MFETNRKLADGWTAAVRFFSPCLFIFHIVMGHIIPQIDKSNMCRSLFNYRVCIAQRDLVISFCCSETNDPSLYYSWPEGTAQPLLNWSHVGASSSQIFACIFARSSMNRMAKFVKAYLQSHLILHPRNSPRLNPVPFWFIFFSIFSSCGKSMVADYFVPRNMLHSITGRRL